MADQSIRSVLTNLGTMAATPWAFLVLIAYALLWMFLDPGSLNWHGIATLVTWAMTLVIQRAEHRDTQALQAKLDELIRASGGARSGLTNIDEKEPEQIEELRLHDQAETELDPRLRASS